jgi:hypothetical protein
VNPIAGFDDMEKRKFLTLPGLEILPLWRPARSQSLYRLRYPGSLAVHTLVDLKELKEAIYFFQFAEPNWFNILEFLKEGIQEWRRQFLAISQKEESVKTKLRRLENEENDLRKPK